MPTEELELDPMVEIRDSIQEIHRLLRRSDKLQMNEGFQPIESILRKIDERTETMLDTERDKRRRKLHPMMIEDMMMISSHSSDSFKPYAMLIILSLFKDDFPWIYDAGKDLFNTLSKKVSLEAKEKAVSNFRDLLDYSMDITMRFRRSFDSKEEHMYYSEMYMKLAEFINRFIREQYNNP